MQNELSPAQIKGRCRRVHKCVKASHQLADNMMLYSAPSLVVEKDSRSSFFGIIPGVLPPQAITADEYTPHLGWVLIAHCGAE